MIKLKYADLNNSPIEQVLHKLDNCMKLDIRTAFMVAKFARLLRTEIANAREIFTKMLKKHCKLDEKGNFVKGEDNAPVFVDKDAYNAELAEFLKIEFSLPMAALKLDVLERCELSPSELSAIMPLIEE
jgi:hypothetical protein